MEVAQQLALAAMRSIVRLILTKAVARVLQAMQLCAAERPSKLGLVVQIT